MNVQSVAAEVAAPATPIRTRQSMLFRALAPFAIGGAVLLTPTPEGLTANAWHFFALFLATITGVICEPIPGAAIGLLGVMTAAVLGLVRPVPAPATAWALSGFSNPTVWLVFAAYLLLRRFVDGPERRARLSALFAILGFVMVPVTFLTSRLLATDLHPDIAGPGKNPDENRPDVSQVSMHQNLQ